MAYAAIRDIDLDVMRPGRTARNLKGFKRLVASMGAIGFHSHRNFLSSFFAKRRTQMVAAYAWEKRQGNCMTL
jgi:hypothetical protein